MFWILRVKPWEARSRVRISAPSLDEIRYKVWLLLAVFTLQRIPKQHRSPLFSSQTFWTLEGSCVSAPIEISKTAWHGCRLVIYPALAHIDAGSEPPLSMQSQGPQTSRGHEMHSYKGVINAAGLCWDIQIWEFTCELGREMALEQRFDGQVTSGSLWFIGFGGVFFYVLESLSFYIAHPDLELRVLLPQSFKCRLCCEPLCLTYFKGTCYPK